MATTQAPRDKPRLANLATAPARADLRHYCTSGPMVMVAKKKKIAKHGRAGSGRRA